MDKYKIKVKLCTEAIFGSGYSIPGSVDLEIVHDKTGLPYMKAKTFKGNLREQVKNAVKLLEHYGLELADEEDSLFGKEDNGTQEWATLRFSDCCLGKNIRELFEYAIDKKEVSSIEVIDALTGVRSFTSIDKDGASKEGSLRQYRVIKKGLEFYVDINCERELTKKELAVLSLGICLMRHIGSMRSRGKGEIEAKLLVLECGSYTDRTQYYIEELMKEVAANE